MVKFIFFKFYTVSIVRSLRENPQYISMSSRFHKNNILYLIHSTKTQPSCTHIASGSFYQSRPNSRLFITVLMYSICLESCTSSLLLCCSSLKPLGTSQGSSWHMVKTGETCWRLPGCGPQSPDVQWHIVFKQTVSVAETLRKTEKDFSNRGCFLPQAIFSLKEPRHLILFLLFQGVAATPTDHLRG